MLEISDVSKKDTIANSTQMIEFTTPTAKVFEPAANVLPNTIKLSQPTSDKYWDLVGLYSLNGSRNGAPSYKRYLSQSRAFLGQFIKL